MGTISTINLHLTSRCNYSCKFCFAHFAEVKSCLNSREREQLIITICNRPEIKKINFVGGEPTLITELSDLLSLAHSFGKKTSLTTNGSLISPDWVRKNASALNILTLSIDSSSNQTKRLSGRCDRLERVLNNEHYYLLASACKESGVNLKVNTVVSRFNVNERMTDLINRLEPIRWKVFQALTVEGENSEYASGFVIDDAAYHSYIKRNKEGLAPSICMIAEDSRLMRGSYLMVNPEGCFFDNSRGRYTVSQPITNVGYSKARAQVTTDYDKFILRGGLYSLSIRQHQQ